MTTGPRRRRRLSAAERAVWQTAVQSVKPLPRADAEPAASDAAAPEAPPARAPATVAVAEKPSREPLPRAPAAAALAPLGAGRQPVVPLGRRERQKLARGRETIDARLDLHGLTQVEAHAALKRFLQRAQGDGARFVLVVTGKGGRAAAESGVLRRQVPRWLASPEFRNLVLAADVAHASHGGEGALYVRLRRLRGTDVLTTS